MRPKYLSSLMLGLLFGACVFIGMSHHKQDRLLAFFNKCCHTFLQRESSALTGNIKIVGRRLIVDGKPFIMKGVCYNPVRKGGLHPTNLITTNPTPEDLVIIEKDFQMMHDAGVNTIRTYEPLLDDRILDLLLKYQLRTIVPVLNYHLAPFYKVTSIVTRLKKHPSTLIWEVGNEWNRNYFYSKDSDPAHPEGLGFENSVMLIKNAARCIKALDTTHPVSTDIGTPKNEAFWGAFPIKFIDLYGMNIYDWLAFGDWLRQWAAHSNKPLYLGEFGTDAFNTNINAKDEASQEIGTRSLIQEVQNNLSALNPNHVLVGGAIFEWSDEWWKDPNGTPHTHDNGGIIEPGEGPYPDRVFNEEWWGLLDIDRNPRPAYLTVKELYLKK